MDRLASGIASPRMVGRVDREVIGKRVDKGVPQRSAGGVQVDEGRAAAADLDLGFEIAVFDRD